MSMSMSDEDLLAEGFREEFPGVWASPLAQEMSEDGIDWSNEVYDQDSFDASQCDNYNY